MPYWPRLTAMLRVCAVRRGCVKPGHQKREFDALDDADLVRRLGPKPVDKAGQAFSRPLVFNTTHRWIERRPIWANAGQDHSVLPQPRLQQAVQKHLPTVKVAHSHKA
jgi:hypothetical protein